MPHRSSHPPLRTRLLLRPGRGRLRSRVPREILETARRPDFLRRARKIGRNRSELLSSGIPEHRPLVFAIPVKSGTRRGSEISRLTFEDSSTEKRPFRRLFLSALTTPLPRERRSFHREALRLHLPSYRCPPNWRKSERRSRNHAHPNHVPPTKERPRKRPRPPRERAGERPNRSRSAPL